MSPRRTRRVAFCVLVERGWRRREPADLRSTFCSAVVSGAKFPSRRSALITCLGRWCGTDPRTIVLCRSDRRQRPAPAVASYKQRVVCSRRGSASSLSVLVGAHRHTPPDLRRSRKGFVLWDCRAVSPGYPAVCKRGGEGAATDPRLWRHWVGQDDPGGPAGRHHRRPLGLRRRPDVGAGLGSGAV